MNANPYSHIKNSFSYLLHPVLDQEHLNLTVKTYKEARGDVFEIWTRKYNGLRDYFKLNNITNVVLGVSGGVDSALVLALLSDVAAVQPLTIRACVFTFDQYDGIFDMSYVKELQKYGSPNVRWVVRDLSAAEEALRFDLGIRHTDDQKANVNYALRYQAMFAVAQAFGGVTIGTTNFDEFGYAGWFGKNSDMMVDLQCITDLHKFEVNRLAAALGVPSSIVNRSPTGDLISEKTDEECFGVSYDELSWFTAYMTSNMMHSPGRFTRIDTQREMLNPFMREKFKDVIELHKKNSHKYMGQTFNPIFIL